MSDNKHHEPSSVPGSPVDYNRGALSHLLGIHPWRRWEDMLDWLRSEGPNDPFLSANEHRALRQDAERAHGDGAPFVNDLDRMWAELRRHHKPAE
jgi:hypothetical protein